MAQPARREAPVKSGLLSIARLRQTPRMLRLAALVALLFGAGFSASGCATRVDLTPTRTIPVSLESEKKLTEVTVSLQNLIVITLPAAEPGCTWQISFHDPR